MDRPIHHPRGPVVSVVAGGQSVPGKGAGARWLAVGCVTLIQIAIWIYVDRFLYQVNSTPTSHSHHHHYGGAVESIALLIVGAMLVAIVIAPPAAATAAAPRQPFLIGLFVAAVPSLVALAEYRIYRYIPDSEYALAAAVLLSLAAFILGVVPAALIRRHLRIKRRQESQASLVAAFSAHSHSAVSADVWPPPPSL